MSLLELSFLLFILFQCKHFVADFPLQLNYMAINKTKLGWGFFLPLLSHASVHSALTLIIALIFAPSAWWVCLIDLAVHFTMDRIKSHPHLLGRFNDQKKAAYWWCLGFDQLIHHLTDLLSIWIIIHHT